MPKPKLIDKYSMGELSQGGLLISSVVTEFLHGIIPPEEELQLVKDAQQYDMIRTRADLFDRLYDNRITAEDILGDTEDINYRNFTQVSNLFAEKIREEPINIYHAASEAPMFKYSTITGLDKVIKTQIKTAKKVAKLLEQQIDKMQTEEEKQYAGFYLDYLNHYVDGTFRDVMKNNPGFMFGYRSISAYLTIDTPGIFPTVDNGKFKVEFISNPGNWKKNAAALKGSGILETIDHGVKLNKLYDAAKNNGPAERESLLREYEAIEKSFLRVKSMTQKEYDDINNKSAGHHVFQNELKEFTKSPRTGTFTSDDAAARITALKAGYPVQDLQALSSYYYAMKSLERNIASNKEPEKNQELLNKLQPVWESAMEGSHKTPAERKQHLEAMTTTLLSISSINKEELKGTFFYEENSCVIPLGHLAAAADRKLSLQEKAFMTGDPKDILKVIEEVDPARISSSEQFKKMKEAVTKLTKIDAGKNPEKYELQKAKAIRAAEDYLKYKDNQLHDPANPHKRTENEEKRISAAGNVLSSLIGGKNPDLLNNKRPANPKQEVSSDEMYVFKECYKYINAAQDMMIEKLEGIKAALQTTQKDPNKNFTNTKKMEGSDSYRRMTQALQNSINVLKNGDSTPTQIKEALEEYERRSRDYQKAHDSIFKGNHGKTKTVRQLQAEKAMKDIPVMLTTYDELRMKFAEYENNKGIPCSHISRNDLKDFYIKASENINRYPELEYDNQGIRDRINNMHSYSEKKVTLKNMLNKKHPDLVDNYSSYREPSYYMSVIKDNSVESVAKAITVKKMMDKIYTEPLEHFELDEVKQKIESGSIERDAEKLARDPVFKMVVKNYPNNAFQKWETVNNEINSLQQDSQAKMNSLMEKQEHYSRKPQSLGDAVYLKTAGLMDPYVIGDIMVDKIMSGPQGKGIASIIAAAPKNYQETMKDAVQSVAGKYIKDLIEKNPNKYMPDRHNEQLSIERINTLMNDPEISNKLKNHLLKSQKKVLTRADEIKKQKAAERQVAAQPNMGL